VHLKCSRSIELESFVDVVFPLRHDIDGPKIRSALYKSEELHGTWLRAPDYNSVVAADVEGNPNFLKRRIACSACCTSLVV
jgi:hypothetical protein